MRYQALLVLRASKKKKSVLSAKSLEHFVKLKVSQPSAELVEERAETEENVSHGRDNISTDNTHSGSRIIQSRRPGDVSESHPILLNAPAENCIGMYDTHNTNRWKNQTQ